MLVEQERMQVYLPAVTQCDKEEDIVKKRIGLALLAVLLVIVAALVGMKVIMNAETNIPKLYFNGDISEMNDKKDIRSISVSFRDGDMTFEGFAELKVQGTSSLRYEKKNYTITFFKDENHTEKMEVDVGWGAQNKYCLKANWIDKTHARNIVTAHLVTEVQRKYNVLEGTPRNGAIDGFPIEIYNNDKFLGLYTFNIPKDEWLFNMDGDNENHIVICGEGWEDANLFLAEPNFEDWELEVGEESPETLEKVKRLFDFVMNSTDEEFKSSFGEYINLDAALNYFVLTEYAFLKDNRAKNMLIATYDGELWYPSLYDLDSCWGSRPSGEELWKYDVEEMYTTRNNLFARMEKNFGKELAERYFELRETVLKKEHILDEFNLFRNEIPKLTFIKEKIRWGKDIPGYDISQIEEYLDSITEKWDDRYKKLLEEK